jgi:cell division protein FtsN
MDADITKTDAVSRETARSVAAEMPPATKPETPQSKIYYAIIGSFVTEKQANQFMNEINMPGLTSMGIVKNEERVRVYAGKFTGKKEAEDCIHLLRKNEKLKNTWLFVGQ